VEALILARASTKPAPVAFLTGSLQYFPVDAQSETFAATVIPGRAQREPGIQKLWANNIEIPGSRLRRAPA
jgi:hypothetical protein